MIVTVNPYVRLFKMHKEKLDEQETIANETNGELVQTRMYLVRSNNHDELFQRNRYQNYAVHGEIAAIFEDRDGRVPSNIHVSKFDTKMKLNFSFNYNLGLYLPKKRSSAKFEHS